MSLNVKTIFTAIDRMTAPIKKMAASTLSFAQRGEAGVARLDRGLRKLTPNIGMAVKMMAQMAIIGGIIAVTFNSLKAITEFETGLVGVGKTAGIAGVELKALGQDVITTSMRLKTISSKKLLELAEVAGQLGVKGSKNILTFATVMAELEKSAPSVQGEEGAKQIARLLNIAGEAPATIDRFTSSLVALGNNSATAEAEILEVASEVGRSTNAYNLSSTAVLGISTALKSLGAKPQAAGSAVGMAFAQIELATITGGKELQTFAKIMDTTQQGVIDTFAKSPLEAFKLFIKGLARVGEEGGSIMLQLKNVGLSSRRVSKGLIPLAKRFNIFTDAMNLSAKAASENNARTLEFLRSQETVQSGLDAIGIAWENVFIRQATAGDSLFTIRKILFFVADNIGLVISGLGILIGLFILGKLIVFGFNIVLGITSALSGTAAISIGSNAVALTFYGITLGITTAAQWLLNVALGAGAIAMQILLSPITLIIIAILALVAVTYLIIKNWNDWGAAVTLFLGPLGLVISLIQSFRRNWDMIKEAFKTGGILEGLKAIGATLLDSILMPLQQLLEIASNIPGAVGDFAGKAAQKIQQFRENIGVNVTTDESGDPLEAVNPKVEEQKALLNTIESTNNAKVQIDVNDKNRSTEVTSDTEDVTIFMESTQSFEAI